MQVQMLASQEYELVEAVLGDEGVRLYAERQPDLVLLDAMMPHPDGFEVCRSLREQYGVACAPILMVTSLDDRESVEKAFEAGAFDYVTKPFSRTVLRNRIARLLEVRHAQRSIEERNFVLESLNLITRVASTTIDLSERMSKVAHVLGFNLDVPYVFVYTVEPTAKTRRWVAGYVAETARQIAPTHSESLPLDDETWAWLQTPERYFVGQVAALPPTKKQQHYAQLGVQTVALAPLITLGGEMIGYLEFWEDRRQRELSPAQAMSMVPVAREVATLMNTAILYARLQSYSAELEARNQELDAYNHTIAHDLKNPLSSILSYSWLVRQQLGKESKLIDYLDRVIKNSERMAQMIDQLLQMAQLRHAAAEAKPIDVLPLVKSALERVEHQVEKAGIVVNVPDELPLCVAHAPWIEEVFANLIANAIKYRGSNPQPRINISGMVQGGQVRYAVQDNGVGIQSSDQERLFQMFSRLENNTEVKGFGLGLSIVKRIVTKLNGQVGVESSPDTGSTFWFTLPIPQEQSQ